MDDGEQQVEMSEFERIEFNRRTDMAYSVIPAAARLFSQRSEFDERIKNKSKASSSYWYWIFFFLGIALHYALSDGSFGINWGSWIALMALGSYCVNKYEIGQLRLQRDRCNDRLHELEVTWEGATAHKSFWDISRFASESGLDDEDDAFRDWWSEKRTWILERVCGYEKGRQIGEDLSKRDVEFRRAQRALHDSRV